MRYEEIKEGIFRSRPNRFLAWVEIDGEETLCHVKNTGRCKELLIPGVRVILEHQEKPGRKTAYSLIAVYKGQTLINTDSQAPNPVAEEWLRGRGGDGVFGKILSVKREVTYGQSRFDFFMEIQGEKERPIRPVFMEVKGVTLEEDGIARFPDAPTERGVKHVKELTLSVKEGYEAYLLFVVQMKGIRRVEPNWVTHPAFGQALEEAKQAGVRILAYDCQVTPDSLMLDGPVPVELGNRMDTE
jgi:sugar fermentation stimulation protein A